MFKQGNYKIQIIQTKDRIEKSATHIAMQKDVCMPATKSTLLNSFRIVGKYKIYNLCLQTYPCKHYIEFENGETKLLTGDTIYRLFEKEGLVDDHFEDYKEYVRRQDFPTMRERIQRIEETMQSMKSTQEQKERRAEEQVIVDRYKASSRLEKLKQKHNIKPDPEA